MNKITVLFVSDSDDKYGAPRALIELINVLKRDYNIAPIVLTSSYSRINTECQKLGIKNYVTYHRSYMINNYDRSLKESLKNCIRLLRYVICRYLSVLVAEYKIEFNNVYLIHSNSNRCDLGAILAKRHNIKHIMHLREESSGCKPFFNKQLQSVDMLVDSYIAISNKVKIGWSSIGINSKKISVVYDGIDIHDIVPKSYYSINTIFKIVMVGSLSKNKGQEIVIRAINCLPNDIKNKISLSFYGDGEYKKDLVRLVNEFCLKNVYFKGYCENIKSELNKYDCGISASDKEGFGRTTVEYMAAGLPVLGANSGATPEIISSGINGFLFNRNDYVELSEKIAMLFNNQLLRKKIGEMGKKTVNSLYTTELNGKGVFSVYKNYI